MIRFLVFRVIILLVVRFVMIAIMMSVSTMFTVLHVEFLSVLKFVTLAACESKARNSNPNQHMTQRFHGISLRVAMSFCNFQVFSYTAALTGPRRVTPLS